MAGEFSTKSLQFNIRDKSFPSLKSPDYPIQLTNGVINLEVRKIIENYFNFAAAAAARPMR